MFPYLFGFSLVLGGIPPLRFGGVMGHVALRLAKRLLRGPGLCFRRHGGQRDARRSRVLWKLSADRGDAASYAWWSNLKRVSRAR